MTFLFDTICDDIIGEITKYFVWTASYRSDNELPIVVQRLLYFPLEKPIITLQAFTECASRAGSCASCRWWSRAERFHPIFEIDSLHWWGGPKRMIKNKIKTNEKGMISYTHNKQKFKQIEVA